ncbi:MAG TPA: MFS transporter [Acidobacteria bacterium]|nr:MFS transporter [Acidobacteriota bacterium]
MHLFAVYFFLVVLPLEREWAMPYHELISLWTVGSLLVGAMALPAGWLGDRWSAPGMLVLFFLGLGGAAIICGLATSPTVMWAGLSLLGAFAAIYHPVGVAWLVRTTTESRGKALGINGVFGNAGVAGAGLVAGSLIDLFGWRIAFLVPGAISLATGVVMLYCLASGRFTGDATTRRLPAGADGQTGQLRAFVLLLITMFGGAIIYQATQIALPKIFAVRLVEFVGSSTFGVGAFIALVYGFAGLTQVASGYLADRFDLKMVYIGTFLLQIPVLWIAASAGGVSLIAASTVLVVANTGSLPAENMLLAAATPEQRHGVAFGLKFALAFGAAPLAIKLVAYVNETTGSFSLLFTILTTVGIGVVVAAALLPKLKRPQKESREISPEPNALAEHTGTL